MDNREKIRRYIWAATRKLGLTPTELARKAGVSPSTLTRFLNKDVEYMLSTATLAKIAIAAGKPDSYLSVISTRDIEFPIDVVLDALEIVEQFLSEENITLPPLEKRKLVKLLFEAVREDQIDKPNKILDFSAYKGLLNGALKK